MLVYYGMAGAGLVGRELRVRAIAITGFSCNAILSITCAVLLPIPPCNPYHNSNHQIPINLSLRFALSLVPGARLQIDVDILTNQCPYPRE